MARPADLPLYTPQQFDLGADANECDIIMKGGVTSGIVYPFAILEIATRYRFRSLGGTSAGAIAAAFAAAAEYSRTARKDSAGFVRLQRHCEELPERLLSLFQPDPPARKLVDVVLRYRREGARAIVTDLGLKIALTATWFGAIAAELFWLGGSRGWPLWLGLGLGAVVGAVAGLAWVLARHARTIIPTVSGAVRDLPERQFGACSGLREEGQEQPALTDWLHAAIQDIAFGADDQGQVLTFGHLRRADPPIDLQMVTTNLSMMRPHTLPDIRLLGGFKPAEWSRLFPAPVMAHLTGACRAWRRLKGALRFPTADQLPVIVATRMSLSFPLLFKSIPLYTEDFELYNVVRDLEGTPVRQIRKLWFSDGGISSNFPIHMFDSPLPSRPTFAVSLDDLPSSAGALDKRVLLPQNPSSALGVPVQEIGTLTRFLLQIFYSAKDWQDQLLSEITGQRERIAHVYLTPSEGGLNLGMDANASWDLMRFGLRAGEAFTSDAFDFDEHKWRRTLAFFKTSAEWIDKARSAWVDRQFAGWYRGYSATVESYRRISKIDRQRLADRIDEMLGVSTVETIDPERIRRNFPRKTGVLRNTPTY